MERGSLMRIHMNMPDDELIQRMKDAPTYLKDPDDVDELIKRFNELRGEKYQREAIADATE